MVITISAQPIARKISNQRLLRAGGVTIAALFGISIPMLLRLVHLEPRVAAGPIALAGADVVTILFYLCLARWLVV